MNALRAELIDLVYGLPDVDVADLLDEAKARRARFRLVKSDESNLKHRFSFVGAVEDGPLDGSENVDFYIRQRALANG